MADQKLKKLRETLVGLQADLAEKRRLNEVKWSPLNASAILGIEAAIANVRIAIEARKEERTKK